MRGTLKPVDYERLPSGVEIRWRSAASFERKHMTQHSPPLLNPSSPQGTWEITDSGRNYLAKAEERGA